MAKEARLVQKKGVTEKETQRQKLNRYHTQCVHAFSCAKNIVNLSQHNLTPAEQSVLSKGLPKPKNIDLPNIRKGLIKFRAQIANIYQAEYRQSLNEIVSQSEHDRK